MPDRPPSAHTTTLPPLSDDGTRRAIAAGAARRTWDFHHCLHELFEAQAARTPAHVAVRAGDVELTYAELDARANRLARDLRRAAVGPDVPVGLSAQPSADLVVGLLGILKAGGAYVPLDPDHPADRLRSIAAGTGLRLVVTDEGGGGAAPADLERVPVPSSGLPAAPGVAVEPDNLVYVMHTSGSTGQPKGAMLTHRNVVRLLDATGAAVGATGPDERWVMFHRHSFDISVWETWGALLRGGTVHLVPNELKRSAERFLRYVSEQRLTVLVQTPSAFKLLLEADERLGLDLSLRLLVLGGEPVVPDDVARWMRRHPDGAPRVVNMYGITETTVWSTYRFLDEHTIASGSAPIGRHLDDVPCHVLDSRGDVQPAGAAGELHIGGDSLARGYVGQPGLTAERFVPDPLADTPGARRYRTGDLVRRDGAGELHFLGRLDHQVKISGHRVELGDVDAHVRAVPQVTDCLVTTRDDEEGHRRLVAYCIPADADLTPRRLRAELRRTLPAHMVPSIVVLVDAWPVTPNGKVDRAALSALPRGREGS
jgi:amino acid adenylation domain-containing protein